MYTSGLGLTTCEIGRWLTMGSPAGGSDGRALIFVHIPQVRSKASDHGPPCDRFFPFFSALHSYAHVAIISIAACAHDTSLLKKRGAEVFQNAIIFFSAGHAVRAAGARHGGAFPAILLHAGAEQNLGTTPLGILLAILLVAAVTSTSTAGVCTCYRPKPDVLLH